MRTMLKRFPTLTVLLAWLLALTPLLATRAYAMQGYSTTRAYWVPFSACMTTVSGNATGTQGFTTAGTSGTPVVQAQTSASGTNTHNYVCTINPQNYLITSGAGIAIQSATFYYGVVTSNLGTQVATLASGTMNSVLVFSYIDFPTAGAGETASTVAPVRADSGSLTITPAVASFNVTAATAGQFYSVMFTPATPIVVKVINRQLLLSVSLLNTATSATVTNSPGIMVRYTSS